MLAQRLLDCGESKSLITESGDPRSDRGRDQRWQEVETDACDPLMSGLNGCKVYPWIVYSLVD